MDKLVLPTLLGKGKISGKYYLIIIKQGIVRFLSYSNYFFLDRSPEEEIEAIQSLPLEVETELREYLTGVFHYEFKKKRRNSKNAEPIKIYTQIEPGSLLPEKASESTEAGGTSNRRARKVNPAPHTVPTEVSEPNSHTGDKAQTKRRAVGNGLQLRATDPNSGSGSGGSCINEHARSTGGNVSGTDGADRQAELGYSISATPVEAAAVKRKRGRPRKLPL